MDIERSAETFKAVLIQAKDFVFDGNKFQPIDGYFIGSQKAKWYELNKCWAAWQVAVKRKPCCCIKEEATAFQSVYNANGMEFNGIKFEPMSTNPGTVRKATRVNYTWRAWLIAVGRGEY